MYADEPLRQFTDELASGSPAPGGGSAAALAGVTAASLVSMVCNLTIGRAKFASADAAMRDLLMKAERLRIRLLELVDEDTLAYPRVISAYRMPRETDEQKQSRRDAIQQALIFACQAPTEIASASADIADLCPGVARQGNPSAVSDAGVGALLAAAACESAILNVTINLESIRDASFVDRARAETGALVARARASRDETLARVQATIASS